MIHDEVIDGRFISLKPVMPEDAEFILNLRQRKEVYRYMHRVDVPVAQQIQWIKTHQEIDGDYYFLIWNKKNERIGTISLYNKKKDHCDIGRAASIGNSVENVEAFLLTFDFAFDKLEYNYLVGTVVPDNWQVKGMCLQFGIVYDDEIFQIDGISLQCGQITKEDYYANRQEVARLLEKVSNIIDE